MPFCLLVEMLEMYKIAENLAAKGTISLEKQKAAEENLRRFHPPQILFRSDRQGYLFCSP